MDPASQISTRQWHIAMKRPSRGTSTVHSRSVNINSTTLLCLPHSSKAWFPSHRPELFSWVLSITAAARQLAPRLAMPRDSHGSCPMDTLDGACRAWEWKRCASEQCTAGGGGRRVVKGGEKEEDPRPTAERGFLARLKEEYPGHRWGGKPSSQESPLVQSILSARRHEKAICNTAESPPSRVPLAAFLPSCSSLPSSSRLMLVPRSHPPRPQTYVFGTFFHIKSMGSVHEALGGEGEGECH